MQVRELELQLADTIARLDRVELEIGYIKNPLPSEWLNPAQVEQYSRGKYPAKLVREKIELAIAAPENMPLQLGEHYTIDRDERGRVIRVNYLEFDRVMVAMMRENAFF